MRFGFQSGSVSRLSQPGSSRMAPTETAGTLSHCADTFIVAIALASQVAGWETRNSIEQRARRGEVETLRQVLDRVPERPPLAGEEARRV